ncbi:IMP dehydrogenase [Actinoplanes philippinensis]|uniref:IMP dehydrogenase n=1 Tax=Actinoplanes philippinensis TaxID=35752 RepID=UPI003411A35E
MARHRVGDEPAFTVATPLVSAIMGAVSSEEMAIALARAGGIAFIRQNQPIGDQAGMVLRSRGTGLGSATTTSPSQRRRRSTTPTRCFTHMGDASLRHC